jgi:hypothetical protein
MWRISLRWRERFRGSLDDGRKKKTPRKGRGVFSTRYAIRRAVMPSISSQGATGGSKVWSPVLRHTGCPNPLALTPPAMS